MKCIEKIKIENGCIQLPMEFAKQFKPKTEFIVRIERFGVVIIPKTNPTEDLIGCVKTLPINIEKMLDEREEENDS